MRGRDVGRLRGINLALVVVPSLRDPTLASKRKPPLGASRRDRSHTLPRPSDAAVAQGESRLPEPANAACESECTRAAKLGAVLFRHRGWLPVPFLAVPLLAPGDESRLNWVTGIALLAVGEAVRLWGIAAAGTSTRRRSRNVQRLITYGAFAWSRNPLYNGNFLAWLGFVVVSGVHWFIPVVIALFAIEYSLIVRYEEGVLESTFGEEYLRYRRRVPRWIPARPPAVMEGEHDWRGAWYSERSTFLGYVALVVAFVVKGLL